MKEINLPYGKGFLSCEIPQERINEILTSRIDGYVPTGSPEEVVRSAMEHPIGSAPLKELARGKKNFVVIASDHTRPVPSKVIIPPVLEEIREGAPNAEITILIATGCHRAMKEQELIDKFGEEIVRNERIVVHDCDKSEMTELGVLPSGGPLTVNRLVTEADLAVSEGFIEPHLFAGYSGGRKSILPGVAARKVVLANHNGEFVNDPHSRTGILKDNPIHRDMIYAAKHAGLRYIVNVVLNEAHEPIYAVAGDIEQAHLAGCDFLAKHCEVKAKETDIVISTNGGYPLDQNIYQSVKGMTAAEAAVKPGGVIIMASECEDGVGGDYFYQSFVKEKDLSRMMEAFVATPADQTVIDQWESQVLARILMKAHVIYISGLEDPVVENFHMIPAKDIADAICKADEILGREDGKITVIPDGIGVVVKPDLSR